MRTLLALAVVFVAAAAASAQDCPNGRCPVPTMQFAAPLTPTSMYTSAPAASASMQSDGVRVEWFEQRTRRVLFPRLASVMQRKPVRRLFARLLWRF